MKKPLTDLQQTALDYFTTNDITGLSQRELAQAIGFPSHQALTSSVMGLFMKGYLVVERKRDD